jgi:hypothetical protein
MGIIAFVKTVFGKESSKPGKKRTTKKSSSGIPLTPQEAYRKRVARRKAKAAKAARRRNRR